jgi:hypothetical protein
MNKKLIQTLTVLGATASVACGEAVPTGDAGSRSATEQRPLDECASVRSYTAALGEATIRCLGTFGPDTYHVGADGLLVPSFAACTQTGAGTAFRDIGDLLSLQASGVLPAARDCMVESFVGWADRFRALGRSECPTFRVVESRGAPTRDAVLELTHRFDFAGLVSGRAYAKPDEMELHENFVYDVAFADGKSAKPCGDALDCATDCASAFPGWFVGTEDGRFIGDPSWWVAGSNYDSGSSLDPFDYPYVHLMSFYGPPPGDVYAHRDRVGEACTKWAGGSLHYVVTLRSFCLNGLGCMSKCGP